MPGMVYHSITNEGTEVWVDAADQKYRKKDPTAQGALVSVGQGWTQYYYDPFANTVGTKDLSPQGSATPRINNPAVSWTDALGALGFGNTLDLTAKSQADGVTVWVLEAKTPIVDKNGNLAGSLNGRIEIDTTTNLPHAFEKHQELVNGATPTTDPNGLNPNRRIVYKTSEMIARSSLPDNFFESSEVSTQLQAPEQNIEKVRALGLTPLWLGVHYEGPGGILQLPMDTGVFAVSSPVSGEVHYSLIVPTSASQAVEEKDAVIVRFSKDITTFKSPLIPEIGGTLPEQQSASSVNGGPAVLYTSTLTPNDLPCPNGNCPVSSAALYRRLIFSVGDTGVQIETAARVGAGGNDANGYNGKDAIVALAEALFTPPAPDTPTPTPNGLPAPNPTVAPSP
ncbi:MAG: hypothetical protein ABI559_13675 [Chloroflexota bacterium]